MRRVLARCSLALALVAATTVAAPAQSRSGTHAADDSVMRIMPRYPMRGADALITRDGRTALVLTDRTLILQLTDAGIEGLKRGTGDAEREVGRKGKSEPLAQAVAALVGGIVRSVADHGLEYDLRDLGDARWTGDRLELRRASGEEAFGNVEVQGTRVMEDFDAREARAFAARVRATAAHVR